MNLFDLFAKISLDTSGFESGMQGALSSGNNLATRLGKIFNGISDLGASTFKSLGVAIGAGTTALGVFVKSSVSTGMDFDASMSQIAATMGLTTDDIKNNVNGAGDTFDKLRAKAKEMGRTTNFTSTQAAEGLNILAMSGYDAEQSMSMIEDVLHLAAAGSMDMASAAGYVSGAMKGFGDSTKDSAFYADLMAKGATLANTDVTALGEALSGSAAIASSYNQTAESTTLALLRLAEQGETGSAAATALSAAMKNLYAPTDQARKLLDYLGVNAFDPTTGKARDFNLVVNELSDALSGYTDEQKTMAAQMIFGIQGFNAYNKMVVTSVDKQYEWAEAIANASGEAAKQYATMTDNLKGDLAIMSSSIDGFKTAISDSLTDTARSVVQNISDIFSGLTTVFESSGIDGIITYVDLLFNNLLSTVNAKIPEIIETIGSIWNNILSKLNDSAPRMIDVGRTLLTSLLNGWEQIRPNLFALIQQFVPMVMEYIMAGKGLLFQTGLDMIMAIISGIGNNIGELVTSAQSIIQNLIEGISQAIPTLLQSGMQIIQGLIQGITQGVPQLLEYLPQVLNSFIEGINTFIPMLIENGTQLIQSLAQGVTQAIPMLFEAAPQILSGLLNGITSGLESLVSVGGQMMESIGNGLKTAIPNFLSNALPMIMEFSGKLRENAGKLVDAGLNMIMNIADGIIKSIPDIIKTVPTIISNIAGVINDNAPKILQKGIELVGHLIKGIIQAIPTIIANIPKIITAIVDVFTAFNWLNLGKQIIDFLANGIKSMIATAGNAAKSIFDAIVNGIKNLPQNLLNLGKNAIQFFGQGIYGMITSINNIANTIVSNIVNIITSLPGKMLDIGKNLIKGLWNGITNMASWLWEKITGFAGNIISKIKGVFGIHSPSTVFAGIGKNLALGLGEGWDKTIDKVTDDIEGDMDFVSDLESGAYASQATSGNLTTTEQITTININIDGSNIADSREMAETIAERLQSLVDRRQAVWA